MFCNPGIADMTVVGDRGVAFFSSYFRIADAGVRFAEPPISGGDRHFLEILRYWPDDFPPLEVIAPEQACDVFPAFGLSPRVITLPFAFIDVLGVVPAYLARIIGSFGQIRRLLGVKLCYSAADFLPSVAAPFLAKVLRPARIAWIGCCFHLIPPPQQRSGNFFGNLLSHHAQRLSLELMRRCDMVIVDNALLKNDLIARGFKDSCVFVTSMGVRIPEQMPIEEKKFDGCFFGRLHPAKGIFDLLEAWALVRERFPAAKLAVIGDRSVLGNELDAAVVRLKLRGAVEFFGYLARSEVDRILAQSRLFTFPSHEEGWCIAAAEAMAAGLPVVLYDLPALREVFPQGARFAPLRDVAAFAATIIELLSDEQACRRQAAEASALATTYTWHDTTNRIFEKVRTVLRCSA
jgi:glycosyltransferase involved in cell wall biosynthesis